MTDPGVCHLDYPFAHPWDTDEGYVERRAAAVRCSRRGSGVGCRRCVRTLDHQGTPMTNREWNLFRFMFASLVRRGLPEHRRRELDATIPGTPAHSVRSFYNAMVARVNTGDAVMQMWLKAQERMDVEGMFPYLCPVGDEAARNVAGWREAVGADRFRMEILGAPFQQDCSSDGGVEKGEENGHAGP